MLWIKSDRKITGNYLVLRQNAALALARAYNRKMQNEPGDEVD